MKYAWIKQHRATYPVELMCDVLAVCVSGFHAWDDRPPSARRQRQVALTEKIRAAHTASRQTYGSPRIHRDLLDQGETVCKNTVARLMRHSQIRSVRARRFVPCTTDSKHDHPVAGNVLNRDFTATAPNRKWVCDITYIPTAEGWLYLAATLDLFSRRVVGWSMADHYREELVGAALTMALTRRQPKRGLLHHSDRGSQYACEDYQKRLNKHSMVCSMSRTGNCYDNAAMESFFSTLKTELIYRQTFATRKEARKAVFEFIEVFYNRVRRHSSLGFLSPEAFEAARF